MIHNLVARCKNCFY